MFARFSFSVQLPLFLSRKTTLCLDFKYIGFARTDQTSRANNITEPLAMSGDNESKRMDIQDDFESLLASSLGSSTLQPNDSFLDGLSVFDLLSSSPLAGDMFAAPHRKLSDFTEMQNDFEESFASLDLGFEYASPVCSLTS
jgi:hypothetical protein